MNDEAAGADRPAPWWVRGIVYQIYPRSFQDTNGDGVGDLAGIIRRLPYLQWLGIDAIWISPFYPSPMADFGYDVADYCDVDPIFGTLADFDRLVAAAHEAGIRIILDFVPNHTSNQHPWFLESRSSRDNPKRDWYVWKDPRPDDGVPNNWISNFGGSAWTFDAATGQYYYHAFLKEQPDLNWRNPAVRAAMHDALRFWLDRGVDGFRVDVIWHLIKDGEFRDNPVNPGYEMGRAEIERLLQVYSCDQPEIHQVIAELRAVLDAYDGDRVLIGEIYLPLERLVAYYGENLEGAHLPFNFQLLQAAWDARHIRALIAEYEAALPDGGWPNWVLGNHDRPRIAGRLGPAQAKIAAMLLLTLRGTPTLYYGDEIGMEPVPVTGADIRDPWELNEPDLGLGRDPSRTPMQWDRSPGAGFTEAKPWLPLARDWQDRNVEVAMNDPDSLLSLYRRLIALRREEEALSVGAYLELAAEGDILAYQRTYGDHVLVVVLNLGHHAMPFDLPPGLAGEVIAATHGARDGARLTGRVEVAPDEGFVLRTAPH
ncbi:MAG: DUF3459 domain-containing protein [Bauldia sp.]|nr:DUF3459 domain-containing protein [Bauldia sp.]